MQDVTAEIADKNREKQPAVRKPRTGISRSSTATAKSGFPPLRPPSAIRGIGVTAPGWYRIPLQDGHSLLSLLPQNRVGKRSGSTLGFLEKNASASLSGSARAS